MPGEVVVKWHCLLSFDNVHSCQWKIVVKGKTNEVLIKRKEEEKLILNNP